MAESNVVKVIVMMMLIMGTAAAETDVVINEKIFSKECAVYCSLKCTFFRGKARALCVVLCLLGCKRPPVVSKDVVDCTNDCAESMCSKYENSDIDSLTGCIADICGNKCPVPNMLQTLKAK